MGLCLGSRVPLTGASTGDGELVPKGGQGVRFPKGQWVSEDVSAALSTLGPATLSYI